MEKPDNEFPQQEERCITANHNKYPHRSLHGNITTMGILDEIHVKGPRTLGPCHERT